MHVNEAKFASSILGCVEGVNRYHEGRAAEASEALTPLVDCGGAVGVVARHFAVLARRSLGSLAAERGDLPAAEAHLRSAAALAGAQSTCPPLAGMLARAGRARDCLEELERTTRPTGGDAAEYRRFAQAAWQAGRHEEACLILSKAIRRIGAQPELLVQMGLFLASQQQYAPARDWLRRAAEADRGCGEAYRYLGLCEAALGEPRAAVKSLQRALDLRPQDVGLAHQLALAARAAGATGAAPAIHLPAPSSAEQPAGELSRLAAMLAEEPQCAEALLSSPADDADEQDGEAALLVAAAALLALQQRPAYADLHLAASRALGQLGCTGEAIGAARRALEHNERFVQARLHLAELYAGAGLAVAAAEQAQRAVDDGADWPDARVRTAELLRQAGLPQRARFHLERALQLKNRYRPAEEALRALAA